MKLFVIILVILALLFAVGIGLGARGGGGGPVDVKKYDWLGALTRPFGAGTALDPSALSGPCIADRSLKVSRGGLGCSAEAPPGKWVRTLELKLMQGRRAALDFEPAGGASLPARQRLGSGEVAKITVPAEGGSLHVVCQDDAGTGACVLGSP